MHALRGTYSSFLLGLCCAILSCGGGTGSGSQSGSPPPTIASVSSSCQSVAVPVSQSTTCSAAVQGTGAFSSSVTWSVNKVVGGNSTVGLIDSAGSYTAPASVPTPFTVTISAASAEDPSSTSSVAVIIIGIIDSASQSITASIGGTIALADGSSVTIAAGALPSDQLVTLSEVSYLPHLPPNSALGQVGASLVLSFGSPVRGMTSVYGHSRTKRARSNAAISASAFVFSVSTAVNTSPGLVGSLPFAGFVEPSGSFSFTGVQGNYNSTASMVTGSVGFDLLSAFTNGITTIYFSAINFVNYVAQVGIHLFTAPNTLILDLSKTTPWQNYSVASPCPSAPTLVVVHGMAAFVEDTFATDGTIQNIKKNGNYQTVLGFDYNWLQSVKTSGAQLASFLDALVSQCGTTFDIEAHSEGVPVSLAALGMVQAQTLGRVRRFVSVGGPIMGTPAASDVRMLQSFFLYAPSFSLPSGLQTLTFASVLASPFVTDLQTSVPGDGGTLDQIRSALYSPSQSDAPEIVVVAGANPVLWHSVPMQWLQNLMRTKIDGIIPVTSALALQPTTASASVLKVFPLAPYSNDGHNDLLSDIAVSQTVGTQIQSLANLPQLTCEGSTLACQGPRTLSFNISAIGFDSTATTGIVYELGQTGSVAANYLSVANQSLSWSAPACSEVAGFFSVFSSGTSASKGTLASNSAMQQVSTATCATLVPGTIMTVAGTGIAGYSGDLGPALSAQLYTPTGVAFDASGNMYIADFGNNVIRRVDATTRIITTVAGTGTVGFSGDGGLAVKAQLNHPGDLLFDGFGNLYFTDSYNQRIRKIDTAGNITTVAGNGTAGFSGDGGPATNAQFAYPDGLARDSSNNLFIADSQNNRIREVIAATGNVVTVAGNGIGGFSGDGTSAVTAELNSPTRPALDSNGNLYICDYRNTRIREVNAGTGIITTIVGNGSTGFSGDGGPATSAALGAPLSIALDASGNLYISDVVSNRIRAVNTTSAQETLLSVVVQPGEIETVAGNGFPAYLGDGGPATSAELNIPTGLTFDSFGNLFVGDSANNVVRQIIGP